MEDKYIAGVDIGGTRIRVAICTADLKEENIKKRITKTLKENKYSISKTVCSLLSEILKEYDVKNEQLLGIGIATAGPLNIEKGEVFNNANLGFREIPLKNPIMNKFPGIPLFFINDCNGAVLGLHYFEAEADERENLVYVTMSTGIGGGVICNGHLLFGKEGNAAEVGHAIVEPKNTVKCNCGAYGCWEAYSSGTGVQNRVLDALKDGKLNADILMQIVDNNKGKITAKEVFQAAKKGDVLSKKIVEDCIFYTKVGIGIVNNYYDCSSIYFGGAMIKDKEQIIPPLIEQFEKDPLRFTVNHPPKIKLTRYKDEIGLRGALALVKYKMEKHKIIL